MAERSVEPLEVARLVEEFINSERRDVTRYENREQLDDSGALDLHELASRIYALGFKEGVQVENWRWVGMRDRAGSTSVSAQPEGDR